MDTTSSPLPTPDTVPPSEVLPDEAHLMEVFARMPIQMVRGSGMELIDAKGTHYLDFLAGIGTVNLGHSDPKVAGAIASQAAVLTHVSNFFYIEHRSELADRLVELFGAHTDRGVDARVFFANSGAEAVEGALKLARKWASLNKPEAHTIVTARDSFHGRTFGAMTATGQPERSAPFAPLLPGFTYVAFNDIDALEDTLGADTIALMLEVVQGESGVWPATTALIERAATLCQERNILLIIDEIQTGIYRTGPPFAFQHYPVTPDIITSAKGLGNGMPIAAIIARTEVASAFAVGDHGTTFGGGPLACAAARATLEAFDELRIDGVGITEHVSAVGAYAREKLATLPYITEVRGMGLMIGMTLAPDSPLTALEIRDALACHGFIVNAIGERIIRLLPPLICTSVHIDSLITAMNEIMNGQREEAL